MLPPKGIGKGPPLTTLGVSTEPTSAPQRSFSGSTSAQDGSSVGSLLPNVVFCELGENRNCCLRLAGAAPQSVSLLVLPRADKRQLRRMSLVTAEIVLVRQADEFLASEICFLICFMHLSKQHVNHSTIPTTMPTSFISSNHRHHQHIFKHTSCLVDFLMDFQPRQIRHPVKDLRLHHVYAIENVFVLFLFRILCGMPISAHIFCQPGLLRSRLEEVRVLIDQAKRVTTFPRWMVKARLGETGSRGARSGAKEREYHARKDLEHFGFTARPRCVSILRGTARQTHREFAGGKTRS